LRDEEKKTFEWECGAAPLEGTERKGTKVKVEVKVK